MKNITAKARHWIQGLALVSACLAGPAQAAVYTGVWDPAFGAPFTNLGWRGSADYFVPNTCEPSITIDISNAGDCGGAAAVTRAEVEFYDINDSGAPTLATLVFDPLSLQINTLRYLEGVLSGLSTTSSNFAGTAVNLSGFNVSAGTLFSLQFTLDGPRLAWSSCARDDDYCERGVNDSTQFPATFTIQRGSAVQVPEPGSLALTLLALGALSTLRRRRG